MQYLMLLFADEKAGAAFSDEDMGRAMDIMGAYNEVLKQAGALVMTAALQRTNEAKTLRMDGGEPSVDTFVNATGSMKVHDGPYADTREQLGGFYVIEAADMDAALEWAGRCPASQWGSIEVRELLADYTDAPRRG